MSNIPHKKTSSFMSQYDRHVFLHVTRCSAADLTFHMKVLGKFLFPSSLMGECRGTCSPNHRQYWTAKPGRLSQKHSSRKFGRYTSSDAASNPGSKEFNWVAVQRKLDFCGKRRFYCRCSFKHFEKFSSTNLY